MVEWLSMLVAVVMGGAFGWAVFEVRRLKRTVREQGRLLSELYVCTCGLADELCSPGWHPGHRAELAKRRLGPTSPLWRKVQS
jgi:hypothetical protein